MTLWRRSSCNWWPFGRAELREADIVFNPSPTSPLGWPTTWDHAAAPAPPHHQGPFNAILVGVHEHGHAFGLDHENDGMATLNATYPGSGVIGNDNDPHPHADDIFGNRVGYGTASTSRDLAASAFRLHSEGFAMEIPSPPATERGSTASFQFTVENRGTAHQSSVPVNFYLSQDRFITTADLYLGQVNVSLNAGASSTLTTMVTIPADAPTGSQRLGWIIDPFNAVAEAHEGNNGVGLVHGFYVRVNRAPTACFTATPDVGPAPLQVTFDASCSSDLDGHSMSYSWDFDDGSSGTGQTISHQFDEGFYIVTLTVTDSLAASDTTDDLIKANCAPVAGPGGRALCED